MTEEERERTTEDMIQNIADMDLSRAEQIYMFVQLCDEKVLMQELNKKAMLVKIGLDTNDAIYSFTYGILRLAKPHLFETKGSNGD